MAIDTVGQAVLLRSAAASKQTGFEQERLEQGSGGFEPESFDLCDDNYDSFAEEDLPSSEVEGENPSSGPAGVADAEEDATPAAQAAFLAGVDDPALAPDQAYATDRARAAAAAAAKRDARTDDERTADLLNNMAPHRRFLLGILDYCREPRLVQDVEAKVKEMQHSNRSVFDAAAYCHHLKDAGALKMIGGEEEPNQEQTAQEQIDPREDLEQTQDPAQDPAQSEAQIDPAPVSTPAEDAYVSPAPQREMCWVTTEVGLRALAANRPADKIRGLLEDEAAYESIFLQLLDMCDDESGATARQMGQAVDSDPLLQSPRKYAQHFFNELARAGAIAWDGDAKVWRTTREGHDFLESEGE